MASSDDKFWEEILGFNSELDIDKRWILRADNDTRGHGSLRVVSHPDCKYGHLRAYMSVITKRRPKTAKEIEETVEEYQMDINELEVYSINEHVETWDTEQEAPLQEIEQIFGIKIF